MQQLPSPPYLHLVYRPEFEVLIGRWMQPVTPQELQEGYFTMLEAGSELPCRLWLVDGRRRQHSHKGDAAWMRNVFFPLLAPRLGGQAYLAYLFTPSHLEELQAEAGRQAQEEFGRQPYQVRRFIEEQAAMQWLEQARYHLSPLAGV